MLEPERQKAGALYPDLEQVFLSDRAFHKAGQALGLDQALRLKVQTVREHLASGQSPALEALLQKLTDQGMLRF